MARRKSETSTGPGSRPTLTWLKFQEVCATLAKTGGKYMACETNGFSYHTVSSAMAAQTQDGDDEWQDLWDLSYAKYKEGLVQEARKRATDGWDEPVFHLGKKVATVNKKSDRLLEVMLKAHVPEEFTTNVNVQATVDTGPGLDILKDLTLAARKQIRDIIIADMAKQKADKKARDEQAAAEAYENGTAGRSDNQAGPDGEADAVVPEAKA